MAKIIKRIIILKNANYSSQTVAIVKAESIFYSLKIKFSGIDFSNKNYDFIFFDGKNYEKHFAKLEINSSLDISNGIYIAVLENNKIIASGISGKININEFNSFFLENNINQKIKNKDEVYDDERIAEFDYYRNRQEKNEFEKLYSSKQCPENESKFFDEHPFNASNENNCDDETSAENSEKEYQKYYSFNANQNDENFNYGKKQDEPYYITAQKDIESLFSRGTREKNLECVVPYSKWSRICYSSGKYYVVGIVEFDNNPKYICYGIPGVFGNPPEKLKPYASFIPSSLFSTSKDGYYIMFQNALTGELITPSIKLFGF